MANKRQKTILRDQHNPFRPKRTNLQAKSPVLPGSEIEPAGHAGLKQSETCGRLSLETVKLFLTIHPGNPNVLDKKGNLPLFYACEQSASLDVIYLLTANSTDWLVNAAQFSATQRNPI